MTGQTTASMAPERRARWKWFLALGVLLLCFGIAGGSATSLTEFTSVVIFGPLLLASGILQLLVAIPLKKKSLRFMHFAAAAVEMIFGFVIMAHPLVTTVNLFAVIAIFLVLAGLLRLGRSFFEAHGRKWTFAAAIIALLLGASVWSGWPSGTFWFVGLCIAIDFLCHGVSWIGVALADHKSLETQAA